MMSKSLNASNSPEVKIERLERIAKVREIRNPKTAKEQIALVRGATIEGISMRNKINRRREYAKSITTIKNFDK